jgi:tetratricopeptide (TPR) repeat protein
MVYNNRGFTYQELGEYDKAIADFDKAIELNPEYAVAYNNRGFVYQNQGEHDKATADFDEAIALDPEFAMAYNNRGFTYLKMEQFEQAIADFDEAIASNPELAIAYLNRGYAYEELGEYEMARADYEHALELAADHNLRMIAESQIERLDMIESLDMIEDPPLTLISYEHPSGAFTIDIPKGWTALTIKDDVRTIFLDEGKEDSQDGIMVITFEDQSAADFAEQTLETLFKDDDYEILYQTPSENQVQITARSQTGDIVVEIHGVKPADVGFGLILLTEENSAFHRSWYAVVDGFTINPEAVP